MSSPILVRQLKYVDASELFIGYEELFDQYSQSLVYVESLVDRSMLLTIDALLIDMSLRHIEIPAAFRTRCEEVGTEIHVSLYS